MPEDGFVKVWLIDNTNIKFTFLNEVVSDQVSMQNATLAKRWVVLGAYNLLVFDINSLDSPIAIHSIHNMKVSKKPQEDIIIPSNPESTMTMTIDSQIKLFQFASPEQCEEWIKLVETEREKNFGEAQVDYTLRESFTELRSVFFNVRNNYLVSNLLHFLKFKASRSFKSFSLKELPEVSAITPTSIPSPRSMSISRATSMPNIEPANTIQKVDNVEIVRSSSESNAPPDKNEQTELSTSVVDKTSNIEITNEVASKTVQKENAEELTTLT
jgi:hypothetical protein